MQKNLFVYLIYWKYP